MNSISKEPYSGYVTEDTNKVTDSQLGIHIHFRILERIISHLVARLSGNSHCLNPKEMENGARMEEISDKEYDHNGS